MHFQIGTEYAFVHLRYESEHLSGLHLTEKVTGTQIEVMECVHSERFGERVGYQFLDRHSKIWVGEEFVDENQRIRHNKPDPGMVITRSDPLGKNEFTQEFFTLNFVLWKTHLHYAAAYGTPIGELVYSVGQDLSLRCFKETGAFFVLSTPTRGEAIASSLSLNEWLFEITSLDLYDKIKKINAVLISQGLCKVNDFDELEGVTALTVLRTQENLLHPYVPRHHLS